MNHINLNLLTNNAFNHLNFKPILISVFILTSPAFISGLRAQSLSHDPAKMNQITVAETGEGVLTPELYYQLLHSDYKQSAPQQNKTVFRTAAYIAAYNQIKHSQEIDSVMESRSKIEALNMADRSGGITDLAWVAESDKLTEKFNTLQTNINRLIAMGVNPTVREDWIQKYNMLYSGLEIIRSAYLSNAERKRQYLQIYKQVCRTNELLVKQIANLSRTSETNRLLYGTEPTSLQTANKSNVVSESLRSWKSAIKQ